MSGQVHAEDPNDTDGSVQVFLNIPYETTFQHKDKKPLFRALAYIASLTALGMKPVLATDPKYSVFGNFAERAVEALKDSSCSVHHLSLVKHNNTLELGMAFALSKVQLNHTILVVVDNRADCESILSDLKGVDMYELPPYAAKDDCDGMIEIFTSIQNKFSGNDGPRPADDFRTVYACLKNHGCSHSLAYYPRGLFHHTNVFTTLVTWAVCRWRCSDRECNTMSAKECEKTFNLTTLTRKPANNPSDGPLQP